MSPEQETILLITQTIADLPPRQLAACKELIEHIKQACEDAGDPVGMLAIAYIGASLQLDAALEEIKQALPK